MATTSIGEELMEKIKTISYRKTVAPLSIDQKLPDHVYQQLKRSMKGRYTFNYELFSNRRGTVKPNGIFELFARYSGKDVDEIRECLIDHVRANKKDITAMTASYFGARNIDLAMWTYRMSRKHTAGDELALFLLCQLYDRHAVIHNKNEPWCTMESTKAGSNSSLEEKCDIVLIYMTYGFCEATKTKPSQTVETPSQTVATSSTAAKTKSTTTKKITSKVRTTTSIKDLLDKAQEKEKREKELELQKKLNKTGINKRNLLDDGPRQYNTREPNPMRTRYNERSKRGNVRNKNYSDNIDDYHLDCPQKRRRKQNTPSKLRSPSRVRVIAQEIIKLEQEQNIKIKNEDTKPSIKLEDEEIKRIELRNKKQNEKKTWPKDARLVHMDGTQCSEECMRTSIYHKDLTEEGTAQTEPNSEPPIPVEDNSTSTKYPNTNTCTERSMPSKQLEVATACSKEKGTAQQNSIGDPVGNSPVNKANTSINRDNDPETTTKELNFATTDTTFDTTKPTNSEARTTQLEVQATINKSNGESTDNMSSGTDEPTLNQNAIRYDIDKSTTENKKYNSEDTGLPDIPTVPNTEYELPGATLTEPDETTQLLTVTMTDDSLPLLKHTDALDDFEALMNLDNDCENSELMPIGRLPANDFVKDMNQDMGINDDLEIAMENTRFLRNNTAETVAPQSSPEKQLPTPVSPRGQFRTKTHGIRKLTPEEKRNKKFKCNDCDYFAYSRKAVGEHYTKKHGKLGCDYCDKIFPNPHALKRHMYDHSNDKRQKCHDCGKKFYFESELAAHRIIHREIPTFHCMSSGCGKKFLRASDLNAHIPVHSGILHKCTHPGCTYSNADKRLVKGHQRSHSAVKTFKCKYNNCDGLFKHTMARLRHYKNDH